MPHPLRVAVPAASLATTRAGRRPRGRRTGLALAAGTVAAIVLASDVEAKANGAYPDGLSILVPSDRPQAIALATNFGIIASDDDGQSWHWGCEQPETAGGNLYTLGPAPADRIFAISAPAMRSSKQTLAYSEDNGCSWHLGGGQLDVVSPVDYFADPIDPQRVLAIGEDFRAFPPPNALYLSSDAGKTFPETLYTAASGALLTGVETARTDSRTIYLSMIQGGGGGVWQPSLLRSMDGGVTWATHDLTAALGSVTEVRLVAVDRTSASRVFLRVLIAGGDELAVVDVPDDGGAATVRTPVQLAGPLTGFVQRANGTVLVSGLDITANARGVGFQSTDGALSFTRWPSSGALPAFRGLAERNGLIYGAADDLVDGFALASSSDEGATWLPLMKFSQVSSIMACAASACFSACQAEAQLSVWNASVCSPADASTDLALADGGDGDATPLAGGDSDMPAEAGAPSEVRAAGGGGCSLGRSSSAPGSGSAACLLLAAWLARRVCSLGMRTSSATRHALRLKPARARPEETGTSRSMSRNRCLPHLSPWKRTLDVGVARWPVPPSPNGKCKLRSPS